MSDDGSIFMGGYTSSSRFVIVKLDAYGDMEWEWTVRDFSDELSTCARCPPLPVLHHQTMKQ